MTGPAIDEWEPAGLCYYSATTGNPKGVVYAHRAIYLDTMMVCMADTAAISELDDLMPVVPMFHINAWGLPFAGLWMGAKQVMPGPRPTPADLAQLLQDEKVTVTAGVPTVWLGLLQVLEKGSYDLSHLKRILCCGSAVPRAGRGLPPQRGPADRARLRHDRGRIGQPILYVEERS